MNESVTPIDWDQVIVELRKPNGWIKGELGLIDEADGAVCLLGAMDRVSLQRTCRFASMQQEMVVKTIIVEQFADRVNLDAPTVPDFNDHPDTTLDDVILCCEKARARSAEL